jgi:hypothetical protein
MRISKYRSLADQASDSAASLARLHGALDHVEATAQLLHDVQLAGTTAGPVLKVAELMAQASQLLLSAIVPRPLPRPR